MKISLDLILDELKKYKPVVYKQTGSPSFKRVMPACSGLNLLQQSFDSDTLYIIDSSVLHSAHKLPKHIIVLGKIADRELLKPQDTVLAVKAKAGPNEILNSCSALFLEYEEWERSLLMMIIERVPIERFLNALSEKLTNPVILLDNNLILLGFVGKIKGSVKGTILEKHLRHDRSYLDFF